MKKIKHTGTLKWFAFCLCLGLMLMALPLMASATDVSEPTTYDLWVGGEQFTSEKLTITDGAGGTATYDPFQNILTLKNFTYTGEGTYDALLYYRGTGTLTVKLEGTNTLTGNAQSTTAAVYGICTNGNLIFTGDGSLTVQASSASNCSYGIYTEGDITVESGTITVAGGASTDSEDGNTYS